MNLKRRKKEHTLTTGIVKVCGNEMCYKDNICNVIIAHFLSNGNGHNGKGNSAFGLRKIILPLENLCCNIETIDNGGIRGKTPPNRRTRCGIIASMWLTPRMAM